MALLSGKRTKHQRKSILTICDLMYREKEIKRSLNCVLLQFERKKSHGMGNGNEYNGMSWGKLHKHVFNNPVTAEKEIPLANHHLFYTFCIV